MPSAQVAENLSKVAYLELYKASLGPSSGIASVYGWPQGWASVRFDSVGYVVLMPDGMWRRGNKMKAHHILLNSWMEALIKIENHNQYQYAQVVSIINTAAANLPSVSPIPKKVSAFRIGLPFGIILAVILIGLDVVSVNDIGPLGSFLGCIGGIAILGVYFVAGLLASSQSGKISSGLLAGMWTSLVGAGLGNAVNLVLSPSQFFAGMSALTAPEVIGVIILAAIIVGAFGGAVGAVGGVVGKKSSGF